MNCIRRGDTEAYEELVRTHYKRVYALLAHLCHDTHLAEDLTQDTFLAAWSNIGKFAGRSSLITWLSQIAYRKFIDTRRRHTAREERTRLFQQQYQLQIEKHSGIADIAAAEHQQRLYIALDNLNDDDRTLLTLHYLQDLSYRDMASVLDRPTGTVKWQTSQALQRLRIHLNGELET